MSIQSMLADGRLEAVEPDVDGAEAALDEARRHIEAAASIASIDPNGGYQLAYDAARKVVMSHMRREGFRVRRGDGGHALTAGYASAAIAADLGSRLDSMRRRRNRSEYGTAFLETTTFKARSKWRAH